MRGATSVTLQPHQIPRLPHRMTRMLDRRHIWNVLYNARSNRCHHPTSPNTAPATQNDSHAWSSSHMKRHLQCAEQQVSPSNLTKYCACHTEWLACLIVVTYETSFTMRGATGVTIQPHQILRLPRKMNRLLYRPHIWNVIYNARSNRCHYPTSPNTAPATKNDTARFQRKSPKTGETSFPMRGRSENDPSMIREWSENEIANRNPPRKWGYFSSSPGAFSIVKYNVSSPILHSNIHQVLRLPQKVTLDLHQILPLPRKVTLELHQILPLPRKVTLELHQVLHLPRKVTLDLHQVMHLPRKVTFELHLLYYSTLLDLLCLTLLYLTLLYLTLLYLAYSTWFYSTWHYSTWPTLLDTILLYSTCHHSTWHFSTWLYSTWHYSTWHYSTWPTLLDSTLLDTILLDTTLPDSTLLDTTQLDTTLLDLLYLTLVYLTLFYLTLLYLTALGYSTWLYSTWLYSTWHYSTWPTLLDTTLLYLTLFYLTLLYLTLLGCRSYIGSFSSKLPLIIICIYNIYGFQALLFVVWRVDVAFTDYGESFNHSPLQSSKVSWQRHFWKKPSW